VFANIDRQTLQQPRMKYWSGYCSAVTRDGWRWIVDAHREGRRYIVHSDELLSAFLELEATLLSADI